VSTDYKYHPEILWRCFSRQFAHLLQIFRSVFDIIYKSIYNTVMSQIPDKYTDDPEFQEFLNREFDKTAVCASTDELAEFAFGSFDAATKAFEDRQNN